MSGQCSIENKVKSEQCCGCGAGESTKMITVIAILCALGAGGHFIFGWF